MKKKFSYSLLNVVVLIGIVCTILALVGTPLVLTAMTKNTLLESTYPNIVFLLSFAIYACAMPYVVSLFMLKSVGGILVHGQEFSPKIPTRFKGIALCCLIEIIIYVVLQIVACVKYDAFMLGLTIVPSMVWIFVWLLLGILAMAFAAVFKEAVAIKEENDLTF